MKRIFLGIALFFTFATLEAKSQEYNIIEKSDDFIIIFNPIEELSFHPHLAIPPNITSLRKTTDALDKSFNIATQHCGAQDKSAYIFFRLRPHPGDIFTKPYNFRVFDEDNSAPVGNNFGIKIGTKLRFFCAEESNQAADLYKKYNNIQWTKFYSQTAVKKYESSEFRFEVRETQEAKKRQIEKIAAQRKEVERLKQAAVLEEKRKIDEKNLKQKQIKLVELEKNYGKKCFSKKSNINNYNECLFEQETKAAFEEKQISIKIASMTADDRRSYTCSEKFGFRKGTDKFKDCVFKIYQAEVELEKLELQKELMKANIELAKANSQRQDSLALAQTEAAKMQALAARQQAIAAETGKNLALLDLSARLLAPPAAPQMNRTTCTFNGRFMNCF
jgi:hypothetical protein